MPETKYTKPVCRGSWALGSACGKCERCAETRPAQAPSPSLKDARALLGRIVVYRIEQDERIHLSVMGQHLEGFFPDSREAAALLRLEAELHAYREDREDGR